MNKQLVNLIGAAASAAILLLGILVFALPLFSSANNTMRDAAGVASQNATQQSVLDGLTAQSGQISAIQAEVAELRLEIPETEHLEDVIELSAVAAATHGGRLKTVTPGTAGPFTPRTVEVVAEGTGEPVTPVEEPVAEETNAADAETDVETPAPAPSPAVGAEGPQQVEVTVTFDTPDVATATAIVDALRAGPRLVAVTQSVVQTEDDGVTLTVTLLAFYRP